MAAAPPTGERRRAQPIADCDRDLIERHVERITLTPKHITLQMRPSSDAAPEGTVAEGAGHDAIGDLRVATIAIPGPDPCLRLRSKASFTSLLIVRRVAGEGGPPTSHRQWRARRRCRGHARIDATAAVARNGRGQSSRHIPPRRWASGPGLAHRASCVDCHVVDDPNFPRAAAAAKDGLHGAFRFPIIGPGGFLSVMEFFSTEIREPNAEVLALFQGIGGQAGQFIERKRAEARARQHVGHLCPWGARTPARTNVGGSDGIQLLPRHAGASVAMFPPAPGRFSPRPRERAEWAECRILSPSAFGGASSTG